MSGICGSVAAAMALAFAFGYAGTSVPVSHSELQASYFVQRTPSYPPAMGGPEIVQPIPTLAETRKLILDSADLYATVSLVTTHSSTVDKLAASEALLACADLRPKSRREPSQGDAARELAARCSVIRKNMRHDGAVDRAIELRESAEGDPTPLGRLVALAQRSDGSTRWQAGEFLLVSEALQSNDLVLIAAAISALQTRLDDGSPDSKLRAKAFSYAADPHLVAVGQQAVFDLLVNCANAGRCADDLAAKDTERLPAMYDARERREFERLTEQYRSALQRGDTASKLLGER